MATDPSNSPSGSGSFLDRLKGCVSPARDRANVRRFLAWCVAWALTFIGADWALENLTFATSTATMIAIVPTLMLCGALWAYLRYLREADELVRRIQLEGVALGFGAGIIFLLGLVSLEDAGFAELDANDAIALMLVTWGIGQLFATWRYR